MRQDFTDVTAGDIARLFPVILETHNPEWIDYYRSEKEFLKSVFGDLILRISHIGSSSVPGLIAKPTVDILLELVQGTDLSEITERMRDEGYIANTPPNDLIMYLKGYTPRGFDGQCIHIHVRNIGDWDELYFKDYLVLHPDVARKYGELKCKLKEQYPNDRDGYTEAKGEFIKRYVKYARAELHNKYVPANTQTPPSAL